jgi:4-hydroxy-3-methylbut-2-enyl diphosphate reductase
MKTVRLAESAGFCYGVRRAVEMAEKATESGPCYTLGALIHNRLETDRLAALGAVRADGVDSIPPGSRVIMRSHGSPASDYAALRAKNCEIIDATCPNVARIHRIVREAEAEGRTPVVIGDKGHPELIAICGQCSRAVVVRDAEELEKFTKEGVIGRDDPISVVFQTTFIKNAAKICGEIIKKEYTNFKIFDTMCEATSRHQREAAQLAAECEAMIVVGDRNSANSRHLAELCANSCNRVIFTETACELELSELDDVKSIGITAGASTPAWIIKEVFNKMTEEIKNTETVEEESFDELLEKSIKTLNTGEKVTGIVQSIGTTEVTVDLGTKHSGYIPISELTDDPDLKPEDIVQVGAEIETYVMRVNDVEGTVMLSKKRLDTVKNWEFIENAKETKETVEGLVTEENKGGIIVNVKGIRVFVPSSQSGLPKDAPLTPLVKTRQQLRITEVIRARRRVVGSIRAVQYEKRQAAAEATWNEIEVGKRYKGTVKSLTSYGAFVDIGGVDGMVHVSELSWRRIKNPAEVVKVGDEIEVYVINFNKETKKISLGYKNPDENPWTLFTNKYEVGSVLTVKIVKLMQFGAFAEILPGVDGLIHVSQITNERRIERPEEVLKEGQEVEVKITAIDNENKKVSLSMRALMEAPAPAEESAPAEELVYSTDDPKPEAETTDAE